jgi:hypothetical protein
MVQIGFFKRYGYAWLTLAFFLGSLLLHFVFGWSAFREESAEHGQLPQVHDFLMVMGRDIFENWQSEFLQLLWQVVGLAYFLYLGSPSSKENDDRMEAKIDALLRLAGPDGEKLVGELDQLYARTHGHAEPFAHAEEQARREEQRVAQGRAS